MYSTCTPVLQHFLSSGFYCMTILPQGKIEEMKKQRKALIGQLRDQINRDDITKTLIGHLGSDKEVFISEQMRQHREIADIVRKNLEAQENILGYVAMVI